MSQGTFDAYVIRGTFYLPFYLPFKKQAHQVLLSGIYTV